jgi:hypothetical protein
MRLAITATEPVLITEPVFGWGFSWPIFAITVVVGVAAAIWVVRRINPYSEGETIAATFSVVGIALLALFINLAAWGHNVGIEQRQWAADFHSWANETYETHTTLAFALNLADTQPSFAEECKSELRCRHVDILLDGRVHPAELVFVGGDAALFVDGRELERR